MLAICKAIGRLLVVIAATASVLSGGAMAAPAPAGALIESRAVVSYFNTELGINETVTTNVVVTRVSQVKALDAVFDQTVHVGPGSAGQFAFFIRNLGNVPATPAAELEQLADDNSDLVDVTAVIDQNRNGAADPGEWELTPETEIELAVGTDLPVIAMFKTPPAADDGDRAAVRLSARDGDASGAATGTAVISSAGLVLAKTVDQCEAAAGGKLRYGLKLNSNGSGATAAYTKVKGSPIVIDGVAGSGILVRDPLPLNTRPVKLTSSAGFTGLYHIAGQPEHSYVTTAPADLSTVDAVAFFRAGDFPAGFSANLALEVAVGDNIQSGFILNAASAWQQVDGSQTEIRSNLVSTPVKGYAPVLQYTNPEGKQISGTVLNRNVRLRLSAAACNRSSGVDRVEIRVMTDPEKDLEVLPATETGPNTGLFTTPLIPVQRVLPAVHGDNVISGDRHTKALASVTCGGQTASAVLMVNPGGFAFHSASNAPVPGVTVVLRDASGAEVDRVVTDANGYYVFAEEQPAGTYRIDVSPPQGFSFPSDRKSFPWDRSVHAQASYGKPFTTTGVPGGVDIPLDPDGSIGLRLEKSVDQAMAAPGDILVYSLTLANSADIAVTNTIIHDRLPAGIVYMEGTARIDGDPAKVSAVSGTDLSFGIGLIGRESEVTLTYMAAVEPLAAGRLVNVARAAGKMPGRGDVRSNEARAAVRIQRDGGVFGDEAVVLGKVYVDFNGSGRQDRYLPAGNADEPAADSLGDTEPGIPGVKLHFSNGASVVTDIDGRYSMPGLPPGSQVVAISTSTLPATVALETTSTRDALSPQSRYLRLLPGQVASEYFAVSPRKGASREEVLAELAARRRSFADRLASSDDLSVPDRLDLGGDEWVDYFGRVAGSSRREATKTTETQIVAREQQEEGAPAEGEDAGAPRALALDRTRDLEAEIRGLSPKLSFLDLEPGSLLNSDIISIRVKGPAKGSIGLQLNGDPVSESQVGQRVVYESGGVQAAEYVAVRLEGGRNRLEVTFSDPFGNVRERQEITVLAPGRPARIEIVAPPAAFADPSSPIPVLLRLVDTDGVPTHASMDVTLESNGRGRWGADDIRKTEPGVQLFIDKGEALIDYYPPSLSGTHKIAVRNGLGRYETEVKLLADDSSRIIVGVVEGVVRLPGSVEPATGAEGFDEVAGLNGELYLKGKIKGDALLTLRYDSDRDTQDRLFRDIEPERYYPVYGDASERGYDAQSRSQLYVKVEKGLNYVLYGDIDIAAQASEFQLGSYSRQLTGAQAHVEAGPVAIDLFAGRTDQNQVIREFRAEGLSGPYDLDLSGYAEGSERVEVVTRDRRQRSLVLKSVQLKRFDDYRLDYFGNAIIFNAPIPATDDDGNPNFIRVTYEIEGGGEAYWVYAGEVRYRVNDHIAVGYREIRSDADSVYEDRRTVRAGYAAADLGKYGKAEIEVAQSVDENDESGTAARVGYEFTNDRVKLRARAARAGEGYTEGSALTPGSAEAELAADWKLTRRLAMRTSVIYDRQATSGNERFGAELLPRWAFSPELTVSGGMRFLRVVPDETDEERGGPLSVPSGVLGAEWRPAALPGFSLEGEAEADLTDPSHLRAFGKASHQLTERVKLYSSLDWATSGSEFIDFSSADGATSTMKAGIEYRLNDEVKTYTEARGGSQTGFAGGISGDWDLGDWTGDDWFGGKDTRIYASIERFQPYDLDERMGLPFGADDPDESPQTSLSAGYIASLRGGNARLGLGAELSFKDGGYTAYGHQYWSQQAEAWTLAVENRLANADTDTQRRFRDHLRLGAALRPEEESLDALFLGGVRVERDLSADTAATTTYWSAAGSWALDADTSITGKQAGQYQSKSAFEVTGETFVLLGQAGIEHDFELKDELRLRLGLNGTLFHDVLDGRSYTGLGAEIGFVPTKNVLVAVGYNWSDVAASSVSDIYSVGPYVRLSIKLDDSLWGFFDRAGLTVPIDGGGR